MISIERTFDTDLVRSIMSNAELLKRSGGSDVSIYDPENQPDFFYLTPMRDGVVIGVALFYNLNNAFCYQAHVNYLPDYWGTWLVGYTKEALKYMFNNTQCMKVMAFVPDYYPEVLKHTLRAGFTIEGYLRNSTISNGLLDNQSLVSIEKCQI